VPVTWPSSDDGQRRRSGAKMLELKQGIRCSGCRAKGRAVVSIKWVRQAGCAALDPGTSRRARLGAAARMNAHWVLDRKRSDRGAEALSSGCHNEAENNDVTAAQSPSDRSTVTIK
jgi:hypothetical protein